MSRWSFFAQVLAGTLLAVFVAVTAGLLVAQRNVETEFARILAVETRQEAYGLAMLMGDSEPQASIYSLAERIDRRVSVIGFDGRVLADSEVASEEVHRIENHFNRPEIQQALAQGWGWSTRKSATVGENYLYVAVRDDARKRLIRIAIPLSEYQRAVGVINKGVLAGTLLGFLLAVLIAYAVARALQGQLSKLVTVARKRAGGEPAEFPESGNEDFHQLTTSLAEMTRQLDRRFLELEKERARLRAVLDNMVEGVILCNEAGAIVLWNEAFLELFEGEGSPAGKKLVELTRVPEVVRLSEGILKETVLQSLEFQSQDKEIQATFVPLWPIRASEGYLAVFHDITELRRADRIRRDFVANVSHELRTPLASIAGYAETLLEGAIDDAGVARPFVDGIFRNADRLSRLIEDLLDLARIESGRYGLYPEETPVREAVDAAAQVVTKVASKRHTFKNEVPPDLQAWADRKALSQILVNLIDNAAKYSPPETEITATGRASGDLAEISIQDRGHGIPPEDLPRIFERFYRGDKSRNAAGESGTGLGLAICKHLASEMGGGIRAESSGRGTTITVTLPQRKKPVPGR